MINLLPPESKTRLRSLYRRRLLGIGLGGLLVLLLMSDLFILPPLLLISAKSAAVSLTLSSARRRPVSKEADDTISAIEAVNAKLKLLSGYGQSSALSPMLDRVLSHKSKGISLLRFQYNQPGTLGLDGVAADRQTLLAFIGSLESEPSFVSVSSPISNLIESRDVSFSISLKLKPASP